MPDPLHNLPPGGELRRLLLFEEQQRLDRLEARVGDAQALRESLVPVIAHVLRDAGVEDYRALADSLAPLVIAGIKTEIRNSQDMMVDALYPITGRLVAAAVRNAFKNLVDQLNEKLDSSLSIDRWRSRIKARLTGRSEAEVLLGEGLAFEITDLLMIDRRSGLLVAQAGADTGNGGMDGHLLSSILTAIMAFVRDAMREASGQDLRTLSIGDINLHLQVSPRVILAVKTKGPPPRGFESALSETFCGFLAYQGKAFRAPDQLEAHQRTALNDDLNQRLQSLLSAKQTNFRKRSRKGLIFLLSLGLALAGWYGWSRYQDWYNATVERRAMAVISEQSELLGYPVTVSFQPGREVLLVTGLAPDEPALDRLRRGLTGVLPNTDLMMKVNALPNAGDAASKQDVRLSEEGLREAFQGDIQSLSARIEREAALAIARETSRLLSVIGDLKEQLPAANERALRRFEGWVSQKALRFGGGGGFDNESAARRDLEEIAARLRPLPAEIGLRVVGYTDDSGNDGINQQVSQERAALVAKHLVNLGVAPSRLRAVGRSNEKRLSHEAGFGSVNRRVEFEVVIGEAAAWAEGPTQPGQ